ncbi:hypothetical protein M8J76_001433 [Diaphorina citri]|nr:hypothetical protein M8J76_001433 [Diaphorina citri]
MAENTEMKTDRATAVEHAMFLRNAMQEFSWNMHSAGENAKVIQAHLTESYLKYEDEESYKINEKEMCPYCFNLWRNGYYQMKTIPKVKRKGRYKVTALELLCLQCNKKVKINNSKVRRSEIASKIVATQSQKGKSLNKKNKNKNMTNVGSLSIKVQTPGEKKKKHNSSTLSTPKQSSALMKQVSNSPQLKTTPSASKMQSSKVDVSLRLNLSGSKSAEKKRLQMQKHLKKSNQTPPKPKSALENFLNSVDKF